MFPVKIEICPYIYSAQAKNPGRRLVFMRIIAFSGTSGQFCQRSYRILSADRMAEIIIWAFSIYTLTVAWLSMHCIPYWYHYPFTTWYNWKSNLLIKFNLENPLNTKGKILKVEIVTFYIQSYNVKGMNLHKYIKMSH